MYMYALSDFGPRGSKAEDLALRFTEHLARDEFANAYALTSSEFQEEHPLGTLEEEFRSMCGEGFGPIGPIEVVGGIENWPDKKPQDVQWVYVSIGGSTYSEAVTCVVAQDAGELRIREIEWGRP